MGETVTREQIGAFRRDGAIALRGILGADEVATLARGVERNLADLSPLAINATRPGEPGAFVEDFRNWQRIPEYGAAIRESGRAWRRPPKRARRSTIRCSRSSRRP